MPATPRTRPSRIRPTPPACSSVQRIAAAGAAGERSAASPQASGDRDRPGRVEQADAGASAARARRPPGPPRRRARPSSDRERGAVVTASRTGGQRRRAGSSGRSRRRPRSASGRTAAPGRAPRPSRSTSRAGTTSAVDAPKSSAAAKAPNGRQLPKITRRERDEAAAGGHVLVERADEADREVRAAERGEDARDDDRDVARLVDGDADRVRGARMLADRAQPQADRRLEDDELRDDQQHEREPDHQVEIAERRRRRTCASSRPGIVERSGCAAGRPACRSSP